jgi:hypothetical protein
MTGAVPATATQPVGTHVCLCLRLSDEAGFGGKKTPLT